MPNFDALTAMKHCCDVTKQCFHVSQQHFIAPKSCAKGQEHCFGASKQCSEAAQQCFFAVKHDSKASK